MMSIIDDVNNVSSSNSDMIDVMKESLYRLYRYNERNNIMECNYSGAASTLLPLFRDGNGSIVLTMYKYFASDMCPYAEEVFRDAIALLYNETGYKVDGFVRKIAESVGWKNIIHATSHCARDILAPIIKDQLQYEYYWIAKSKSIDHQLSDLTLHLPSEHASNNNTIAFAEGLCSLMDLDCRTYREMVSAIRAIKNPLTRQMSERRWSQIDYTMLSEQEIKENCGAFIRHDKDRFTKFIEEHPRILNKDDLLVTLMERGGLFIEENLDLVNNEKQLPDTVDKIYSQQSGSNHIYNNNVASSIVLLSSISRCNKTDIRNFDMFAQVINCIKHAPYQTITPTFYLDTEYDSAALISLMNKCGGLSGDNFTFKTIDVSKIDDHNTMNHVIHTILNSTIEYYDKDSNSKDITDISVVIKTANIDKTLSMLRLTPAPISTFTDLFEDRGRCVPNVTVWVIGKDKEHSYIHVFPACDRKKRLTYTYSPNNVIDAMFGILGPDHLIKQILDRFYSSK